MDSRLGTYSLRPEPNPHLFGLKLVCFAPLFI